MVKRSDHSGNGKIYYHDIGDYLDRDEKLALLRKWKSGSAIAWKTIAPSKEGDWLDHRDPQFNTLLPMGDRKLSQATRKRLKKSSNSGLGYDNHTDTPKKHAIFAAYQLGCATNRDAWSYNFSRDRLEEAMKRMIGTYNDELWRYQKRVAAMGADAIKDLESLLTADKRRIAWSASLRGAIKRGKSACYDRSHIRVAAYRPLCAKYLYNDPQFVERKNAMFRADEPNPAICVSDNGADIFSAWATSNIPDLCLLVANAQCFPYYLYTPNGRITNILPNAVDRMRQAIRDKSIGPKDMFHYIYAILHHPTYRERFAGNLRYSLPHIPFAPDAAAFIDIGRRLMHMHIHYEETPRRALLRLSSQGTEQSELTLRGSDKMPSEMLMVKKMKFGKNGRVTDKSVLRYNQSLAFKIPPEAHEYKIEGKSLLEWVMATYQIKIDKDSGIEQDPNELSKERNEPDYILAMVERAVSIGIETARLIKALPDDLGIDKT